MEGDDGLLSAAIPGSTVKSKRQIEKSKTRMIKDTYFLINWVDDPEGDDLYDVVSSKSVVPPDDIDILGVTPGIICKVAYGGSYYKAKVLQIGSCAELKKAQKQYEKEEIEATDANESTSTNPGITSTKPNTPSPSKKIATARSSKSPRKNTTKKKGSPKKSGSRSSPQKTRSPRKPLSKSSKTVKVTAKKKGSLSSGSTRPIDLTEHSCSSDDLSDVDDTPRGRRPKGKASASVRVLMESKTLQHASSHAQVDDEEFRPTLSDSDELGIDSDEETAGVYKKGKRPHASVDDAKREWQGGIFKEDEGGSGLSMFQLQYIQDRVTKLEEKTKRLSGKIKAQAQEITELRRRSVTPSSETSDISFTTPKQHSTSESRLSTSDELDIPGDEAHVRICGHPVDRLKLQTAKLQSTAPKCALKLLQCLFSFEELAHGNPSGVTTAKDNARKNTIKKLDPVRMKYIQDYVESKWPNSFVELKIMKKLTQRCTDLHGDYERARQ